tara:strand:+ start:1361 stop:2191 length:831 start_codon:yes stop_codon:yes gene_type:complete
MSQNYTLSYSGGVQGFPSFYSYIPNYMVGMNNYFYSFDKGNLFRHNTNDVRNQYYGANYPSTITSVFNESPLESKLFKTISLESDSPWDVDLTSDVQTTGFIADESFVKKEGAYFAYLRTEGATTGAGTPIDSEQYPLRSIQGIMNSDTRGGTVANPTVLFDIGINSSLSTFINPQIAVNDYLYWSDVTQANPQLNFAGQIQTIEYVAATGIVKFLLDATGAAVIPAGDLYFAAVKDQIAESYGIVGHYGRFKLTNNVTQATELFAVQSDVMKSYP